mgnify:CR=1 FL=1
MAMKDEDRPVRDDSQSRQANIYQGIPSKFDLIIDPLQNQKVKPTLDQLRKGVKHKKGLA